MFVAAFDESVCKDILTSSESTHLDGQRRKTFAWLFNVESSIDQGELLLLENVVNHTDFVELGTLLRMFEVDLLD